MSIIQEALKKSQRKNITVETILKEPAPQDLTEEVPYYTKKPVHKTRSGPLTRRFNPRITLYGIILISVALVLFIKYYPPRHVKTIKTPVASLVNDLKSRAEPAVIPAPVIVRIQNIEPAREIRQAIKQDDFKLSGIMDLEDGRRAIINNLVVVEGDNIGDVKVEAITINSVTLKKDEESLTLRLK